MSRAYLFRVHAVSRPSNGGAVNHSLTIATTTTERAIELARKKWDIDTLVIVRAERIEESLVWVDPELP